MTYRDKVPEKQLLEAIIRALNEVRKPCKISEITRYIESKKLLPKYSFDCSSVTDVVIRSYHGGEGIFYHVLRGGRRFGLQVWRESPARQVAREIAIRLHTFAPKQFKDAFNQESVQDSVNNKAEYQLGFLREDFIVVQLITGFYRVFTKEGAH